MNDLTKLPGQWRKKDMTNPASPMCGAGAAIAFDAAADQLEAALPKWTKITFNPKTWPNDNQFVMVLTRGGHLFSFTSLFSHLGRAYTKGHQRNYVAWRPLCSIDNPPEESK